MSLQPVVLVVEDEDVVRGMLVKVLNTLSIEVLSCSNGKDALKVLSNSPNIDVILSDIKMPEMDGLTLLAEVRKLSWSKPFIILTAFADKEVAVEALRLGAYDFIEKPFKSDPLLRIVEKALELGISLREIDKEVDELIKAKGYSSENVKELRPALKKMIMLKKESALGFRKWKA